MAIALERADRVAAKVKEILGPLCDNFEVAGSVRRRRPQVNDIDFCLIPATEHLFTFHSKLAQLGPVKMAGLKIQRVQMGDIPLDFYIATPETWSTLLLIRTGSVEHNIKLCARAKALGMVLHADGRGLFKIVTPEVGERREERVAGDSEAEIFKALGLPYRRPEERE